MELLLTIIRVATAILAPIGVVVLAILTILRLRGGEGEPPEGGQTCLHCGKAEKGAIGEFHYTESIGNARERASQKQMSISDTPILGSESHFVCDPCARHFIRNEIIQLVLLAIPYPLYLYILIPLFAENGVFANFLIETMFVVLSVAAITSAFDLYRAVRRGETPLAEARDRVAINQRKAMLGKKFNYYTRMGISFIQKAN